MAWLSFPSQFRISFLRYRFLPIVLLLAMVGITVGGYALRGLNMGVDFQGGLLIEAKTSQALDLNQLRPKLHQAFGREFSLQELGVGENTLLLRTEQVAQVTPFLEKLKPFLGQDVVYRRVESIGPKIGKELIQNSFYALGWALLIIMAYVWVRFEWQFSLCALIALLHDCIGIIAFFVLTQKEFTESAAVSLLITASYSINDTIIIFDRIRENRFFHKGMPFPELINLSINETLSRTLLTSLTTLLALGMLYLFGGNVISAFSLPIFIGILVGTYSSIMIAVPLMQFLPIPKQRKPVWSM